MIRNLDPAVHGLVWAWKRRKGQRGIWHAWRLDAEDTHALSVCGKLHLQNRYLEGAVQTSRPTTDDECFWCMQALGLPVRPPPPPAGVEEMWAAFEGGPFDGERLRLKVVRTSPTTHRVLAQAYDRSQAAARPDPTVMPKAGA